MAFSRLNPRSNRTGVVRISGARQRGSSSSKHLQLWEAIRRTQDELLRWRAQATQVDTLFRQHILPREQTLTSVYAQFTDGLMDRYVEASLTVAEQTLLGLWISENLQAINDHPFVSVTQRETLNLRWRDLQMEDCQEHVISQSNGSWSHDAADPAMQRDPDEDDITEDDVIFEFGWHTNASSSHGRKPQAENAQTSARSDDDASDSPESGDQMPPNEPFARYSATGERHSEAHSTAEVDAKVKALEKRLSIERLFRQLARVLHPDREPDETIKDAKHALMSQCLQARQDKDINTLLTLYCEHIGELPDDLSSSDHQDLIEALELQLRQLQQTLRQQRFGDPLQTQIIERYRAADNRLCRERIERHAQSLDDEITLLTDQLSRLTQREWLLEALASRREVELDRWAIDQLTGYSRR